MLVDIDRNWLMICLRALIGDVGITPPRATYFQLSWTRGLRNGLHTAMKKNLSLLYAANDEEDVVQVSENCQLSITMPSH